MAPKSKVEKSEHFNEIIELLLDGMSPRKLSDYLMEQYDEDIGYKSLQRYRQKHLNIESDVAIEVQKRKAETIKREVARKDQAQQNYDKAVQRGVTAQSVIELAISYGGEIIEDVMNDPNIEKMDKARLLKDYIKLHIDFIKNNDTVVEVNNSVGSLFDEDLIQQIVEDKREKYDEE